MMKPPTVNRHRSLIASLLLVSFLSCAEASAQGDDQASRSQQRQKANKLFGEGKSLFDDGDFQGAIRKFKEAFIVYPSPVIHTRIAASYIWLGRPLNALEHYETFLRLSDSPSAKESTLRLREQVKGEVKKLLLKISQLRLILPGPPGAELRVNGAKVASAPHDGVLRLEAGRCSVIALANGYYPFRRDMKLEPGQSLDLRIKLIRVEPKVIRQVKVIKDPPVYHKWWFWTAIGALVAGGASALGVVYGTRDNPRDPTGILLFHDNLTRR
ncbi:MAG: hypothetical protein RBU30_10700 [Polyangia bacterium]|nr:hypothetical protein [Polyangia bacterium]